MRHHPRKPERTELDANSTQAEVRLRAIRDLHTPWQPPAGKHRPPDAPQFCGGCEDNYGDPVPWPCETRRLADGLPEPTPEPPRRLGDPDEPTVRELKEWGLL